ncbi:MAG: DUF2254 family protein [Planctomycetaceae bacterium]
MPSRTLLVHPGFDKPVAVAAAIGIFQPDRSGIVGNLVVTDAARDRQMLPAIVGVVMTLAAIVFSDTLVAISIVFSQFGSRLLRCCLTASIADRVIE